MVAFPVASNAVGTLTDVRRIADLAHEAGALAWADAVHYGAARADRRRAQFGVDVLICSPYKFFGPHLGVAFARRELIGVVAAVQGAPRAGRAARQALRDGHAAVRAARRLRRRGRVHRVARLGRRSSRWERELGQRFLAGLPQSIRLHGLPTMDGRVPTFAFSVDGISSEEAAARLGERGFAVW